jgi:hypothetical protein
MPPIVKEVFTLERKCEELCPETLGLKLGEAKNVLAEIQAAPVTVQATRFLEQQSFCPDCGMPYPKNGTHHLTFRTLFGTIKLASQRFYSCSCTQAKAQRQEKKQISVSPLANLGQLHSARVYLSADEVGRRHELRVYRQASGGDFASRQTHQYSNPLSTCQTSCDSNRERVGRRAVFFY